MKKIISYLCISIVLYSCSNTTVQLDADTTTATNKALVEKYFKHFNSHNWKAMAALYTDSAMMKDPAYGINTIVMTKAEIEKKYTELHQTIPDVKDSIVQLYAYNNTVVVEFESKGTAPNGEKFVLPICTIFEITNGKISKDLTYYDNVDSPKQ